jgi:hypothetical protein
MVEDCNTEFEEKFSREDLEDFCSTEELDQLFQHQEEEEASDSVEKTGAQHSTATD